MDETMKEEFEILKDKIQNQYKKMQDKAKEQWKKKEKDLNDTFESLRKSSTKFQTVQEELVKLNQENRNLNQQLKEIQSSDDISGQIERLQKIDTYKKEIEQLGLQIATARAENEAALNNKNKYKNLFLKSNREFHELHKILEGNNNSNQSFYSKIKKYHK